MLTVEIDDVVPYDALIGISVHKRPRLANNFIPGAKLTERLLRHLG